MLVDISLKLTRSDLDPRADPYGMKAALPDLAPHGGAVYAQQIAHLLE